jgi:hypothetical protein
MRESTQSGDCLTAGLKYISLPVTENFAARTRTSMHLGTEGRNPVG